jgi:SAM-dependent methyltransferase
MCGQCTVTNLGVLPDTSLFAGNIHKLKLAGGNLYRCESCKSMQRVPIYSDEFYVDLYSRSADDIWQDFRARNDNKIVRELLFGNHQVRTALDVGCNTGYLLQSLEADLKKFGIEPSEKARLTAVKNNIVVLGSTISEIPPGKTFDCVMAIDVIEHLSEPGRFLDHAVKLLSSNGMLIVSTGNPQALIWHKFFKNKFWYSSFAEHISFPSPKFMSDWAAQNNLAVSSIREFNYSNNSLYKNAAQIVLQMSFKLSVVVHKILHKAIFKLRTKTLSSANAISAIPPLPCSGLFRDHYLVVFQRNAVANRLPGTDRGLSGD